MARFSDIPQELRDIIWELAIRPEGPGAHLFTIYDMCKDTQLVESPWSVKISTESSDGWIPRASSGFAAPQYGEHDNFSWIQGNPSTYIEDSALWTACRDSRRHMIRRFRPAETSRRIAREPSWETHKQIENSNAATVTAVLQRDSGERQYFTMEPTKDLTIIQTPPDSCISWDRDIDKEYFPRIDYLWETLSWNGLLAWHTRHGLVCAPRNIAIKFDAKWLEQTEKYVRQFEQAIAMREVNTLWFVDYRLQRGAEGMKLQESKEPQANKKVFNAMGRRFVEVDWGDRWRIWDEAANEFACSEAFHFVNQLEDHIYLDSLQREEDRIYHRFRPDLKVLACEPL